MIPLPCSRLFFYCVFVTVHANNNGFVEEYLEYSAKQVKKYLESLGKSMRNVFESDEKV